MNKTQPNDASVEDFLNTLDESKRSDSRVILAMLGEITGSEPRMWGDSIVGFGQQHYKYASGREGEWFDVGFSPHKQNMTLYLTYGFEQHTDLLQKLGKHKLGKGCLYINKLADVDLPTLRQLVERFLSQHHK
jgi:hypothetical protein